MTPYPPLDQLDVLHVVKRYEDVSLRALSLDSILEQVTAPNEYERVGEVSRR